MKNCILIIDPQNDFCNPDGTMFIPGADEDMLNLRSFIDRNLSKVDGVVVTMDTHNIMDINHPAYWLDLYGNHLEPGTKIKKKEVKGRKYTVYMPGVPENVLLEKQKMAVEYLEDFESTGKVHTISPYHCIQGTWGHNVTDELNSTLMAWSIAKGRDCVFYPKGMFPHVEYFGAFEAEVPDPKAPETTMVASQNVMGYMDNFEKVYLCGEAKSHSVANTLAQIIKIVKGTNFKDLIERYVIVEDVMSDAKGFEGLNKEVFDEAKTMGFEFVNLKDIKL